MTYRRAVGHPETDETREDEFDKQGVVGLNSPWDLTFPLRLPTRFLRELMVSLL